MSQTEHLKQLEAESIQIIREVVSEFKNPVMLYSIGKDSAVMLHLVRKAFYPGKIPFPLLHIDTKWKFPEMIEFRDRTAKELDFDLIVHSHKEAGISHPSKGGADKCCAKLKTGALLDALREGKFDAAFGGARRDEEKSRAKERIFSVRNEFGQWDPKMQRPELWNLFNANINEGENVRIFPISNWTELDVWNYIKQEGIEIVPIYYAHKRKVVERNGVFIPSDSEDAKEVMCRFRSLGCSPCTGVVLSNATTMDDIIQEIEDAQNSERENRVIDHTSESSMEKKKKEGYF